MACMQGGSVEQAALLAILCTLSTGMCLSFPIWLLLSVIPLCLPVIISQQVMSIILSPVCTFPAFHSLMALMSHTRIHKTHRCAALLTSPESMDYPERERLFYWYKAIAIFNGGSKERERQGERECVCVWERERERERVCVCVCMCVCVRERERERENT